MSLRVRAALASVAAAGALVLSGCGSADVAARVDGQVITESDVAAVVKDLNAAYPGQQQPVTSAAALHALIQAPTLIAYAEAHGFPQTASAARAQIPIPDPSDATVQALRWVAVSKQLSQQDNIALAATFSQLKVDVNPKYGTYDPATAGLTWVSPNWLHVIPAQQ
ncbi:MAG TPA: hypothetical protein PLX71_05320 [Phycicoccus sp.]|nr:hypothetical protein [Phycicoccus sp.]